MPQNIDRLNVIVDVVVVVVVTIVVYIQNNDIHSIIQTPQRILMGDLTLTCRHSPP